MSARRIQWAGAAACAALLATTGALAGGKTKLVALGAPGLSPTGISADGTKIVGSGYFGAPIFTWTEADGVVDLGSGCVAGHPAISGDGSTVLGCGQDDSGTFSAALWSGSGWQLLEPVPGGVPCGQDVSSGWGIDYYGHTAVGLVWLAQECRAHGGSWDLLAGGSAADLGSTVPNSASRANAISGDGLTIGGWQDDEVGQRQGALWVGGVEQPVLTAAGEHVGEVAWLNYDATVMIGSGYPYGSNPGFVWTAKGGFTTIAGTQIYRQMFPVAASEDGGLVVGIARDAQFNGRTWIWKKGRLIWADDYLRDKHLASGWNPIALSAVSADGATIAGTAIDADGNLQPFVIQNFK